MPNALSSDMDAHLLQQFFSMSNNQDGFVCLCELSNRIGQDDTLSAPGREDAKDVAITGTPASEQTRL